MAEPPKTRKDAITRSGIIDGTPRTASTVQNPEELSESAKIAYQAFLDMKQSKTAYFGLLQAIENKYDSGGAPSPAENLELEKLLSLHDKNVLAFKTAMAEVTDETEKSTLVQLLS